MKSFIYNRVCKFSAWTELLWT